MEQYHRVYAKINLENIRFNLESIKKKTGVMVMPVIKADAYGHGAVETAVCIENCSDYFAVAVIEEALELRKAGIKKPVLILGTLSSWCYEDAVKNDITVSLYTAEAAAKLSSVAAKLGKKVRVHLKVNTGMNRIGISCDEAGLEIAAKIASFDNLETEGVFSHYATADEADKSFCNEQCARFEWFCASLEAKGISPSIRHICNSAGIMETGKFFDMVRPGIILYGLLPSDEVDKSSLSLKSALELKTHVSCVKKLSAGETVSYGRTYTAPTDRVIATIPVGYADGYPRLLSNCGRVIIRGQYAPIVGRVCMDQFMVDVTQIDGVMPEDDVTLIGTDGSCMVSVDEVAGFAHTINYEIVCGISKRVPRMYE